MRRFSGLFILYMTIIIVGIGIAHAALDDGLIGYWSFDGCNFQDDSGNGNTGAVGGGNPACVEGSIGMAYEYNGTNDFVRIPGVTIPQNQHSFTLWFRPAQSLNNSSDRQDLLYADISSISDILASLGRPHVTFNHDNDGKVGLHPRIEGQVFNNVKSDTNTWEAGRWYHIAFTWNGTRFRTYVDGNREQTRNNPSGQSQTYTGIVLAMRGSVDNPFQGAIDEVRIYNRVLSEAEVQTLAVTEFPLVVATAGGGSGTVASDPSGITCAPDCNEIYSSDQTVTLTATPGPNSDFTEWTGNGCSGNNPVCTVDMNEAREVNARFDLKQFGLTVNKVGSGDGIISSAPAGINCGNDCDNDYPINTVVTLAATADANSIFTGWNIATCPGIAPCTVTLTQALTVTASFVGRFTLTVSVAGTGAGTVISAPPGINCGNSLPGTTDCDATLTDGASTTLTATPAADSQFIGWNGDGCSGATPCTVVMDQNRAVTANLVNPPPVANAGPDQTVNEATLVTLNGSASTDFGDPSGTSLTYNWTQSAGAPVTVASANTPTATFTAPDVRLEGGALEFELLVTDSRGLTATDRVSISVAALFPLSVSKTGTGGGIITATPNGINCGNTCEATYSEGATVTLTAAPEPDSRFIAWSGACTGNTSCVVNMTTAQMVTAEFENPAPTANAGPDQIVDEGAAVTLDASASADFNDALLIYEWMQTNGPPVMLSDPTAIQPTFTAPIVGLSAGFQPGDTLPGFVLTSNPAGSIADIRASGAYAGGQWTIMLTRALATSDANGDVQFDLTNAANLYPFSIAYLDNTGAAPPNAAAVMTTQDTTPYTLGNELSTASLKAQPETPTDCTAFTGDPLVTTPADPNVVPSLTLRAAYDATHIYLCITAPDPNGTADDRNVYWEYLGPDSNAWERQASSVNVMGGAPGTLDEDRIAIWWDINAQDFATEGCMALCHTQRMQSRNLDGQADLWHWQAARTHPVGFAEDQGLSTNTEQCPDAPCRQSDLAAISIAAINERVVNTKPLPSFIANDGPRAMVRALFSDAVPATCPPGECDLAVPATLLDEFLEFTLTVSDERTLANTDSVVIQVVEAGSSDTDEDGVSNDIEDSAPNGGDGNADGVPDRRQAQVASLPNSVDGRYVTLEAPAGITLINVRAVPNPSPGNAPANVSFPVGFFEFRADGIAVGGATSIALILPPGITPDTYYKFGPTPTNPTADWFEFTFDGTTGAEPIVQNRVVLHFVDGQRGDNDLTANGELVDPGAAAITAASPPPPPPAPGGGGGGCTLSPGSQIDPTLLILLTLILIRNIRMRNAE